ncbi:MAG: hypothetical protein HQK77_21575 [Desulfobacterales bacterium]|nr:hypothetical protein [Desulfobacterales bacterium]
METESLIPNPSDDIHEGIHLLREARILDAITVFENSIRIHPNTEDIIPMKLCIVRIQLQSRLIGTKRLFKAM